MIGVAPNIEVEAPVSELRARTAGPPNTEIIAAVSTPAKAPLHPAIQKILDGWIGRELQHLYKAAFSMGQQREVGNITAGRALVLLRTEAEARGYMSDGRYDIGDVSDKIASGFESGMTCGVPVNDNAALISSPFPLPAIPKSNPNPFDLDAPCGLLSHTARWIFATSPSPNAEFAIASALALFAALYGRKVLTPEGLGLNLYMVMVGGTGVGKDRPLKALKQLAGALKQKARIGPNDFASDSALEYLLRHQPCQVLPMDEFGLVLSASGKNADPWSRARRKSLLELYSSATSDWVAKVRAGDAGKNNAKPKPAIEWPTLSILAGTTPSTFYEGLGGDAFASGLMARLLIFFVEQAPALQPIEGFQDVDESLLTKLSDSLKAFAPGNVPFGSMAQANEVPTFVQAKWGDGAAHAVREIRVWARAIGESDETRGQIVNRAGDHTSKLATLRCLARDSTNPVVTRDDVEWAWGVVLQSIRTVEDGAKRFMSASPFEALCKSILEAVRKCKDAKGLKNADLLRAAGVSGAQPRDFEAALRRLIDMTGDLANVGVRSASGRGGRYLLGTGAVDIPPS